VELRPSWEAASWHLLKNFPTFYGTPRFITVFTSALHSSLSWARSKESVQVRGLVKHFVTNNINFWNITPCIPLSVCRRFGGTYRLHLLGRRNKFSKKPASKQVVSCFVLRWGGVSVTPNYKVGRRPLSAVRHCLFSIFADIWRPYVPSPETRHAVVTRDPLNTDIIHQSSYYSMLYNPRCWNNH
jgi:hypothetical protein